MSRSYVSASKSLSKPFSNHIILTPINMLIPRSYGLGSTSLTSSALDSEFGVRVADTVVSRKGVGAAKGLLLYAKIALNPFLVRMDAILMASEIVGA